MSSDYKYKNALEKKVDVMQSDFSFFVDTQKTAGLILIFCVALSLLLINTPVLADYYKDFINLKFGFRIGSIVHSFTIKHFVNDFLLLFFFIILGLEIKCEFIVGELADYRRASIVILGAIGGILFPVVLYFLFNISSDSFMHGWAIPIATDTAIAIGIMSLFKKQLPNGVFPFMAALAVVDDVVAIVLIAVFYTKGLHFAYLFYALALIFIMIIGNISGVRHFAFYMLLGFVLWILFELCGIHGAIAGIIIAFTIPARPKDKPRLFVNKMKALLNKFEKKHDASSHILEEQEQHHLLEEVTEVSLKATAPSKRWQIMLEKPVLLFILPLFALSNGSVTIDTSIVTQAIHTTLFWGILVGLLLGKPLGVGLFTYLGLKFNLGKLPSDMHLGVIVPISLLAGVGYTMSIFISDLAFNDYVYINIAKLSIVISSIVAASIAAWYIIWVYKSDEPN